jgi:hypothetical protein
MRASCWRAGITACPRRGRCARTAWASVWASVFRSRPCPSRHPVCSFISTPHPAPRPPPPPHPTRPCCAALAVCCVGRPTGPAGPSGGVRQRLRRGHGLRAHGRPVQVPAGPEQQARGTRCRCRPSQGRVVGWSRGEGGGRECCLHGATGPWRHARVWGTPLPRPPPPPPPPRTLPFTRSWPEFVFACARVCLPVCGLCTPRLAFRVGVAGPCPSCVFFLFMIVLRPPRRSGVVESDAVGRPERAWERLLEWWGGGRPRKRLGEDKALGGGGGGRVAP